MFSLRNKKNIFELSSITPLIWSSEFPTQNESKKNSVECGASPVCTLSHNDTRKAIPDSHFC